MTAGGDFCKRGLQVRGLQARGLPGTMKGADGVAAPP